MLLGHITVVSIKVTDKPYQIQSFIKGKIFK